MKYAPAARAVALRLTLSALEIAVLTAAALGTFSLWSHHFGNLCPTTPTPHAPTPTPHAPTLSR